MTNEETDAALLIKNVERFAELGIELLDNINNSDASPDQKIKLLLSAKMVFDAGIKLAR